MFKGRDARFDIFNVMKNNPEARRIVRELLDEYFNWDILDGLPNIPKNTEDVGKHNCIVDFLNDMVYNNPEVFSKFLKEKN